MRAKMKKKIDINRCVALLIGVLCIVASFTTGCELMKPIDQDNSQVAQVAPEHQGVANTLQTITKAVEGAADAVGGDQVNKEPDAADQAISALGVALAGVTGGVSLIGAPALIQIKRLGKELFGCKQVIRETDQARGTPRIADQVQSDTAKKQLKKLNLA